MKSKEFIQGAAAALALGGSVAEAQDVPYVSSAPKIQIPHVKDFKEANAIKDGQYDVARFGNSAFAPTLVVGVFGAPKCPVRGMCEKKRGAIFGIGIEGAF